ncbi:hypothetical protein HOS99_gp108 [Staphylococcus phage phiSA_BS1]|uniref:Uncharacterized protein n=2 Tax=Baoshanvirus TaxID=2732969 RepID=A0A2P1MXQ9_9CAUD|nr:hypothetical protein HOS99_gp108 [Staphylococcus phage phiSA_BS1]YP_009800030.1 hypothetical protein HOT02_gp190 [Staphylococcus phage phiSA_BS2]AVP40352.1 hypothetical protein [Staphylococcus phage phiSA_BS1]AVR55634.1 hypothetical protein phiSABS2_190 [Staphylococcus phage phiSA_BS2]
MKLLKQLIQVLDERGIQVNKLNVDEGVNGEYGIEINKEITIVDRGGNYALYAKDASVDKTYYISLTEVLEVLADYLSRVKEGNILKSFLGITRYEVIKHDSKDLYNLLDLERNRLLYLECKSKEYIQDKINRGHFRV